MVAWKITAWIKKNQTEPNFTIKTTVLAKYGDVVLLLNI